MQTTSKFVKIQEGVVKDPKGVFNEQVGKEVHQLWWLMDLLETY